MDNTIHVSLQWTSPQTSPRTTSSTSPHVISLNPLLEPSLRTTLERNILIKDNNKKKKRFHNGLNHLFSIGVELCDILCMVFANLTPMMYISCPKTKHIRGSRTAPWKGLWTLSGGPLEEGKGSVQVPVKC